MKKSLLIGLVVGLIAVPTLSMAGGPQDQYVLLASNRLSEQELAVTSGHGLGRQAEVKNQEGRIVIWDEWARNNAGGIGANAPSPGQVSINNATRTATLSASR